jgi:ADP-ribose pyrophosphatase YjhB (NUDIX family)
MDLVTNIADAPKTRLWRSTLSSAQTPWDSGFTAAQFLRISDPEIRLHQNEQMPSLGAHSQIPFITAGCMLTVRGRVLLSRRAVPPRIGFWTIPGGFVEKGESVEKAALRELAEETGVRIKHARLAAIYSIPQIGQTCFLYSADLNACEISIGAECAEAKLFDPLDIPWNELAFPTDRRLLHRLGLVPHTLEFETGRFHWEADGRIELTCPVSALLSDGTKPRHLRR